MLKHHLKIGLLPVRRWIKEPPKRIGMFQSDYAVDNKKECVAYIKEHYTDELTEFVDIDFLNDEGMLFLEDDCDRVVEYFKEQKIDALFIVNCNFGMENVVGLVASQLKLPTLLWGPRDKHFDTVVRYTDTQCGLFAMSKQLKRANVKFSYIENCRLSDEVFDKGLKKFFAVANMVRNFKKMTVVQIGSRVKPFSCVMYNELELKEKFNLHTKIYNLAEAVQDLQRIYDEEQDALSQELVELKNTFDCGELDDETLKKMLAIAHYYEEIALKNNTNIISSECWTGVTLGWGANPCLAMTLLAAKNIFVTCEWDMHMAITNILLVSASRGKAKPIQGEFTCRHPHNDNAELLWHCGPFPLDYKDEKVKPYLYLTKPSFKLRDGEYTLARFQCEKGKYTLLGGKFNTCEGPETFGTYMWAQFKDLPKLERKLVEGPYIHHVSEVPGDYTEELEEFCKYVDDVTFDPLEE